jgi:hypothetical protein
LLIAYLIGVAVVAFVIACCALAHAGDRRAQIASLIAAMTLVVLSWGGLSLGLLLMLAAPKLHEEGPISWWSPGAGQQFLAACLGVLAILGAAYAVGRERYFFGASLIFTSACLFALWGLLLDAAFSGHGPLVA